ncbi:MAG: hypothetical protein AAF547_05920 [Actinomycetota bacterium]
MQVPVRLTLLLRPSVAPGALLAVGYSTFVLGATPFLLDLVAEAYDVGLAAASLIGVAQLGGFVVGSWGAGHWLTPRRRVFVATLVLAVTANLGSALLPPFAVLVGLRLASGLALGLIAWFVWSQVFGDQKGMGDIALMGPIAGLVASPAIAVVAARGGADGVFWFLAALASIPLVLNRGTGATGPAATRGPRSAPVPAAAVMLVALGLFTLGGSAVFQYAVVLGTGKPGLSIETVALVFSANALASMPATKWPWRRGIPGPWMAATALCAFGLATATVPVVFMASLALWGFAFWMAVPGVFTALAERSANPADRAGDAQAIMAAGRVGGPFLGGVLIDRFGTTTLGFAAAGLMLCAAVAVFVVRNQAPPRADSQLPTLTPSGSR